MFSLNDKITSKILKFLTKLFSFCVNVDNHYEMKSLRDSVTVYVSLLRITKRSRNCWKYPVPIMRNCLGAMAMHSLAMSKWVLAELMNMFGGKTFALCLHTFARFSATDLAKKFAANKWEAFLTSGK